MAVNKIDLVSISELQNKKFIVPNYQRGYKWREKDVEYLIEDIAEIAQDDYSDYCLQPIVVAPKWKQKICPTCGHIIDSTEEGYILVDGQQRLTTIWLIINWAKHNNQFQASWNFDIKYDTREDSNAYLNDVKEKSFAENKGTCDTHYFSKALDTIESKKERLQSFFDNLNKNVKIIWYEIDPKDGPAHFERLNNAKIGLTNAELVKAYLLTKLNQEKRTRMACEWDEMEYKLQNKSFFTFITAKDSIYNKEYNRIELILDLYTGATKKDKEKDEYYTFNEIAKKVEKEGKTVNDVWQDVLNIYNRLLCWYNDYYFYNLIGFLVETRGDGELAIIWKESNGKSTNEIKEIVRARVIQNIPQEDVIRSMVYKDGRTKNVLLLFNVLSLMSVIPNPKPNEYEYVFNDKFHFELYKYENWDKEHVHATASESLQSKVEWVNWLKDLDEKLVEEKLDENKNENKEAFLKWIKEAKNVNSEDYADIKEDKNQMFKSLKKEDFAKMFKDIVEAIEGSDGETDFKQNSIGNLVLLCENINRSGEYKVAPFSTKRRIIMERVKKGQFVPLGTQNVFMKVYTPVPGHFYKWEKDESYDGNEKSDRENYIDAMIETINRIK